MSGTENITGFLKEMGLKEIEIRVYLLILKIGSASAGDLISHLQLERQVVYRALQKLMDQSLIEVFEGRPRSYSAAKIENILNGRIREAKEGANRLEKSRAHLIEEANRFNRDKPQSLSTRFRLIHGRKNIFRFAKKLYDSAHAEICTMDRDIDLIRSISFGVDDVQESCVKRGVGVRKITDINERTLEAAERFMEFCSVRHSSLHSIARISIVDDEEVLFYPTSEDDISSRGEQEVCLWTSNKEYARLIKRSFEAAWEAASDGRSRIKEIKRKSSVTFPPSAEGHQRMQERIGEGSSPSKE